MTANAKAEVLFAALVHDFHHDGTKNMSATFRLETLSADATAPYLEAAGVSPEVRARIAAMVFATEVTRGTHFARACHLHFTTGAPLPSLSAIPGPLALVATDPGLALEAVIVGEADVLSSAGLTVQYGELQQERLAEEWKQPLGAEHKLRFLNQVFQDFTVGRFFSPNLRALKAPPRIAPTASASRGVFRSSPRRAADRGCSRPAPDHERGADDLAGAKRCPSAASITNTPTGTRFSISIVLSGPRYFTAKLKPSTPTRRADRQNREAASQSSPKRACSER
jgi:hypothetical protein